MNYFSRLSCAALMLALASFSASAAPFANGSFETGTPTNGLLSTGDSTSIPSWVVGGTTSTIEFNSPGFNGQNAQQGSNFISFGHNTTTGGTLSQTFTTVIGTVYTVNYFVSRIQGGASAQAMSVMALDAVSSSVLNLAATTIPANNNVWTAGTALVFTASSTSTTLRFTDTTAVGGGGDSNWALDNVTVNGVAAPTAGVPDNGSTIYLLALAATAVALAGRFVPRRARL